LATVITNLLSAIPVFGQDIVELIWGGFSVNNATLNRFFSLHYLLPFLLAALAVAHLIALHVHGSNNPNGVTSHGDRIAMHPYFVFKDLITIFAFFLVLSVIVFFYPNLLGQNIWPNIMLIIVYIIYTCAISWKYILFVNKYIVKIYNKTILISDLFIIDFIRKYIIQKQKISPNVVRYYYKIYNQRITNILIFILFQYNNNPLIKLALVSKQIILTYFCSILFNNILTVNWNNKFLLVGISETISTQINKLIGETFYIFSLIGFSSKIINKINM
jgi:quinol-cytochrome oxidoreductase complex cytochrome b subunit